MNVVVAVVADFDVRIGWLTDELSFDVSVFVKFDDDDVTTFDVFMFDVSLFIRFDVDSDTSVVVVFDVDERKDVFFSKFCVDVDEIFFVGASSTAFGRCRSSTVGCEGPAITTRSNYLGTNRIK